MTVFGRILSAEIRRATGAEDRHRGHYRRKGKQDEKGGEVTERSRLRLSGAIRLRRWENGHFQVRKMRHIF